MALRCNPYRLEIITFMFGTIRRHQQLVWVPIVAVTIITFLWFFMPNGSGPGRMGGSQVAIINGKPPTINGQPIPLDEFRDGFAEAKLFHFFRSNGKEWPENDESAREGLERDTIVRVFMVR